MLTQNYNTQRWCHIDRMGDISYIVLEIPRRFALSGMTLTKEFWANSHIVAILLFCPFII